MTTIKFPRPDGEASFEWCAQANHSEGGFVFIHVEDDVFIHRSGCDDAWAEHVPDPDKRREILLAAEKLRNEKRKLAEDGSEWRGEAAVYTFSAPDLLGCVVQTNGGEKALLSFSSIRGSNLLEAVKPWHRTAYLPLLKPDEAYPKGELPRRMADDEVRLGDGRAETMTIGHNERMNGPAVNFGKGPISWWWHPDNVTPPSGWAEDHPCHDHSQLARLQSFWDKSQGGRMVFNLGWQSAVPDMVTFTANGGRVYGYCGTWDANTDLSPSQRATVESFFAAGPPEGRKNTQRTAEQSAASGEGEASAGPSAVVTEAHSVTPSGEPYATTQDDETLLEWWNGKRKLSVYIDDEGIRALRVGPGSEIVDIAPCEWAAARKWLAGADMPEQSARVTPSGEVKAPFGLEWIEDEADPEVGIKGGQSCHVGNVHCFTNPAPHVDIAIGGVGSVEERLRAAHTALSDHIRRGDGEPSAERTGPPHWMEQRRQLLVELERGRLAYVDLDRVRMNEALALSARITELESAAPDLTELRKWYADDCGRVRILRSHLPLLADIVERLVK